MNRLLFLALCWSTGINAHAQADTGRRFLWFTGRWSSTKKNAFIVTGQSSDAIAVGSASSAGGTSATGTTTVTVENDGSVHINGAGIDEWNRRVRQAAQSEQRFIRQLEDPADNLDPATDHFYQLMLPDAQQRMQEFEELRIDADQDILNPARAKPTDENCRQMKADYDEVIAWWKAHRHDKYDALTYPPPPAFEYNCYACDTGMKKVYQETIDNYVRDFFHPEDDLARKGLAVMKAMGTSIYNTGGTGGYPVTGSTPCSYFSMDDIAGAVYDITRHAFARADKMMRENRKNFKVVEAVSRTWFKAVRKLESISGASGIEDNGMMEIAATLALAVDHYTTELRQNDWRQIGNIPFIVGLMHEEALIGGSESGFVDFLTRLQKIWNGFKLTIEMDIKVGKNGGYEIEHLKGEGHIIPAFQQDSNQCYKWVMADENRVDNQGFYMSSALQTIDCNLLDAEVIVPGDRPKYVGTKFYRATLKSLSMDFCNPGHDTIMLTNMYPNPMTAGIWQYPVGSLNLGDNNIDEFFQSLSDRKRLVADGEAKQAAAQLKQQGEQLVAQMQALKSQMGGPQAAASYEKMMEMKNKAHALTTTSVAGKSLYIDFLLPVHNNNPVLVDKRFDAKEINPAESNVIVYGYYTIHIENDGNGRSKTSPTK